MTCTCDILITDHPEDGHAESRGHWLATCMTCGRQYRTKTADAKLHRPNCYQKCPGISHQQPMRGMGDLIALLLTKVGIKKKGCGGCSKRQAMLNRLFPFRG